MRIIAITAPILMTIALAGCTKQGSIGDKMISQAEETRALGEKCNQGERLISEGKDLINEGKSLKAKGDLKMKEGNLKLTQGHQMLVESEHTFQQHFPTSPLNKEIKD